MNTGKRVLIVGHNSNMPLFVNGAEVVFVTKTSITDLNSGHVMTLHDMPKFEDTLIVSDAKNVKDIHSRESKSQQKLRTRHQR